MDEKTFWRLVFAGSFMVSTAMLTILFGGYILIGAGVVGGLATLKYLVYPMIQHQAEIDKIKAETAQITAATDETRARVYQQMQEFMAQMSMRPDAYMIMPDAATKLYPQFVDRSGRAVGYIGPGGGGGQKQIGPAYQEEEEGTVESDPRQYNLGELLVQYQLDGEDGQVLIGIDANGTLVYGHLFAEEGNFVNSVTAYGDQNAGKSTGAVYLSALTVRAEGRLLVIDPDAEIKPQSLTARLGPLARQPFLLCTVGSDPLSAMRVLDLAEQELERPGDYPVLLAVDECTMLYRHAEVGGAWAEVGRKLAEVAENYATRGRKRRRRLVQMGQTAKASRSGNTEVRDNTDLFCYRMKFKKARLLFPGEVEVAKIASQVNPGQAVVVPASATADPFLLQVPYPDEAGLKLIASRRLAELASVEEDDDQEEIAPIVDLSPELEHRMFLARVRELRDADKNLTEIVKIIFNVTRGGSPQWAERRDQVQAALAEIERQAQLKAVRQANGGL